MSKLIGKYVTKIFYVYDQAFKFGVVRNLVGTLDVGLLANVALPVQKKSFGVQRGIFGSSLA